MKTGRKLLATILSKIKNCATVAGQPRGTPAQFFFQNSPFEHFSAQITRDCDGRVQSARALSFFRRAKLDNFSKIGQAIFREKNEAKREFLEGAGEHFRRFSNFFVDSELFEGLGAPRSRAWSGEGGSSPLGRASP